MLVAILKIDDAAVIAKFLTYLLMDTWMGHYLEIAKEQDLVLLLGYRLVMEKELEIQLETLKGSYRAWSVNK